MGRGHPRHEAACTGARYTAFNSVGVVTVVWLVKAQLAWLHNQHLNARVVNLYTRLNSEMFVSGHLR